MKPFEVGVRWIALSSIVLAVGCGGNGKERDDSDAALREEMREGCEIALECNPKFFDYWEDVPDCVQWTLDEFENGEQEFGRECRDANLAFERCLIESFEGACETYQRLCPDEADAFIDACSEP